jgi:hypothetical protein
LVISSSNNSTDKCVYVFTFKVSGKCISALKTGSVPNAPSVIATESTKPGASNAHRTLVFRFARSCGNERPAMTATEQTSFEDMICFKTSSSASSSAARVPPLKKPRYPRFEEEDPPLEGENILF